MDTLEQQLKSLENLPAVPAALTRLISLLNEDEPDTSEIRMMVQSDRALSLSALRMANSALFGCIQGVSSVEEAVSRLGARNLMKVAITHFAGLTLSNAGKGYGLEQEEAWEGALAGGIAAEVVAARFHEETGVDTGVAFTAGLLRDCGKLAMDQLVGIDELKAVFIQAHGGEQLEHERDQFGFDHSEVGAELAILWGLGEDLQEAIRYHHCPPSDGTHALVDVVYIADMICSHLGYGVGLDGMNYLLHTEVLNRLGIDHIVFAELMGAVSERLVDFEQQFASDS